MNTLTRYAVGALVLTYAVVAAIGWVHNYGATRYAAGKEDGGNAVLASDARAAAQLQTQHDQLNALSALATTTLTQDLAAKLPAIQAQTNDTIETIRTVYRDRPVSDPACYRPASVQASLDAAVDRANSAARGELRPDSPASQAATGTAPAGPR